jgi:hypothetical protein
LVRVFVFTWDRYDSISTSGLLEREGIDHTVLIHNDEHQAGFLRGGLVRPERMEVVNVPKGLTNNRNAALDRMDEGEWALWLVDDLIGVTMLDCYNVASVTGQIPITAANQNEWRQRFKHAITLQEFTRRCIPLTQTAERMGAHLVGFAGFDNPLYRAKRWKVNCLADGRAWLVHKTKLRFDENVQMIDDVLWTAQNLKWYGLVLVDAWILPNCRRYTAQAFGSINQRLEQKRKEVAYLVQRYPQYCAVKRKAGWPDGTHVVIRTNGRRAVRL